MTTENDARPLFWRDDALPFIEARLVQDGRRVCYERHSHDTFSIGAITGGESVYWNEGRLQRVGAGAVVVVNPEDVHACNPIDDRPWSYRMLYVDAGWLAGLQRQMGLGRNDDFHMLRTIVTTQPALYRGLVDLHDALADPKTEVLAKETAAVEYFSLVHQRLDPAAAVPRDDNRKLRRAAEFIRDHCTEALRLDDICAASALSPSYLVRAFKQRYGMTPHAYLTNQRIRHGQARLRRGRPIAEVAAECGFADQAHFQRVFKRLLAATPRQYSTA